MIFTPRWFFNLRTLYCFYNFFTALFSTFPYVSALKFEIYFTVLGIIFVLLPFDLYTINAAMWCTHEGGKGEGVIK